MNNGFYGNGSSTGLLTIEPIVFKKPLQAGIIFAEKRQSMIAEAAYYRAEKRGFQGGDSVTDWLAAELEVTERLTRSKVVWDSSEIMVLQLS